jgi:chlorophyll synthase
MSGARAIARPEPAAILELLKPVTWFAPVWAFLCGAVSSGVSFDSRWGLVLAGMGLAGPLVTAMSQSLNDWYDREVDAINEPHRPIPSGRIPGMWGLWIALAWTGLSLLVAAALGPVVLLATLLGLALAWAYSAPPLRLKRNGWWGNAACGFSYESLAWITGAAVMLGGLPSVEVFALALLYGAGAHGIMTLNDFKAVEGDRRLGINSLPVLLGEARAARVACWVMAAPQVIVMALLVWWGAPWHALAVAAVLVAQLVCMRRMLRDPKGLAPWYGATGVSLYVTGMMVAAFALRGLP